MKSILLSTVAVASMLTMGNANAATCSATIFNQSVPFNCPDPVAGPQGPQGVQGEAGAAGAQGAKGDKGATGAAGVDGKNGTDGKNGSNGTNGQDYDLGQSLALSSAMSMPVWLGDSETVRFSGGVGFSDEGDTAFGITGVYRLDKGLSAFAGGAVSDDGRGAGRAGLSFGW